jgi:hypothetical protein
VVITVREFDTVPAICTRSYQEKASVILKDGALYVRSQRKPESREVATYEEMLQLIELATDKSTRQFIARIHGTGLLESSEGGEGSDDSRYDAELGTF